MAYIDWLALHSSILERYIRGEQEIAAGMVRTAYTDAVSQLAVIDYESASEAEREAVIAAIAASLGASIQNAWITLQSRLARIALWDQDERSAQLFPDAETNQPTLQMLLGIVAAQVIMGMSAGRWWQRQAQWSADAFGQQVRMGLAARETSAQIAQRIMGTVTAGTAFYRRPTGEVFRQRLLAGGILSATERQVRTLVSMTALQSVASINRMMILANSGMFSAIQHISVLDDRTTEICNHYDGKVFSLPDFKPVGHSLPYGSGVPRHWNCRSVEVPVVSGSDFFTKTPRSWNYYKWLEDQSDGIQKRIMGRRQHSAYKAGTLSLKESVSLASSVVLKADSRTK